MSNMVTFYYTIAFNAKKAYQRSGKRKYKRLYKQYFRLHKKAGGKLEV